MQFQMMKIILVLIFIIKTSIDCKAIANVRDTEIDDLTTVTSKKHIVNVAHNRGNSSRMTLPNDVEWIRTTTTRNQEQVVIPAVDSIFELIFAVSFVLLKTN